MYELRPDSNVGGEVYERMLLERLPAHGIELILGVPRDLHVPDPPAAWTIDPLPPARSLHWLAAPIRFTPYARRLCVSGVSRSSAATRSATAARRCCSPRGSPAPACRSSCTTTTCRSDGRASRRRSSLRPTRS